MIIFIVAISGISLVYDHLYSSYVRDIPDSLVYWEKILFDNDNDDDNDNKFIF